MIREIFINSTLVETLGWTLVHSVWQITLIAAALFVLLRLTRRFSAALRCWISIFALLCAFVLPTATFINLYGNSSAKFSLPIENAFPESDERISKNFGRGENLPALTNAETRKIEANDGNFVVSIERIKTFLDKNLAAVLPFFVGLWIFGVAIFSIRLAGGFWQLRRFRTREISAPDDEWRTKFLALYERLKIRRTVEFLQSNLIETPMVVGWLKPLILVPSSAFLQISPQELETIIAHELIHIRRYDCLINFAQTLVEVLFFYHPCVWWISGVIRQEREFAADASVIEFFGASPIIYANALANLEESRLAARLTAPPVLVAANGGNLMQRISKILQKNTEISRANSLWSAGLALMLISAVMLSVFSFNRASIVNAQTKNTNKKIAVGFVSIPPLDRSDNPPKDADATARLLIEKLKAHQIPAIGFLLGGSISDGDKLYPVRADIVRLWRDAGFEIGIGNFKHVWFYDTTYDEYVAGVEKNEAVAKKILAEKNLPLRYFSYPFLNTGKNADERNRFEAWLKERNITPVKYTIDNGEWMYSYAYDMARNDNDVEKMKQIQSEFLEYMSKMFDHFEKYSQEMFGRDINQTMVLTPSRLIADSGDELFGMIEKRGYKFVSMDEAQKDEAYDTPENFYGKSGISWFERWQMAKGKKLLDEPNVHAEVWKSWKDRKDK